VTAGVPPFFCLSAIEMGRRANSGQTIAPTTKKVMDVSSSKLETKAKGQDKQKPLPHTVFPWILG